MLNMADTLENHCLLASRMLDGSEFEEAVIYVISHDDEGATGVIINRPLPHEKCSSAWKELAESRYVSLMYGGPIRSHDVVLSIEKEKLAIYTDTNLYTSRMDSSMIFEKTMLMRGICGWKSRQLEKEIVDGSWIVTGLELDLFFSKDNEKKWFKAMKKSDIKGLGYVSRNILRA